jgi:dCTP deaminase
MYLSDRDIRAAMKNGDILIEDFDETRLQPASYDILLGYEFLVFEYDSIDIMDPRKDISKAMRKRTLKSKDDVFILHPQQLALGVAKDYIGVGDKFCYNLMGKSSLARMGLIIHTTAGFVDPGNALNVTLELFNTNSVPIKLYPEMKIGQVAFFELKSKCERPYGHKSLKSKYFGSRTVEASKMYENFIDSKK